MRIAVTGGVAEGKSTVVSIAEGLGLRSLSSDDVAREVYDLPEVRERIEAAFGRIDRRELRQRISDDPGARRQLNKIFHRPVLDRILARTQKGDWVIEVPLLIEACIQRFFDQTWVVTCGGEEQLRRLTDRLGSAQEAAKLIATQIPTCAKFVFADTVLRTDQDRSVVHRSVVAALAELDVKVL